MTTDHAAAPTAEERRAALVGRVAGTIAYPRLPCTMDRERAEAVLALLKSGEAGVYLVGGSHVQGAGAGLCGTLRARRNGWRETADRLAAILGVDVSAVRPLVRAGVRDLADVALWELADLEAIPQVGPAVLAVLVPALRAVGVELPGYSIRPQPSRRPWGRVDGTVAR